MTNAQPSPIIEERRPGLVTFVAVLLYVQAALFATIGGGGKTVLLTAVLYAIIPLIILWAVWGNDKGEAWFHQLPA